MAYWKTGTILTAAVLALGGVDLAERPQQAPFPDPVLLSGESCLGSESSARRLGLFLGAARAYAEAGKIGNNFAAGLTAPVITYPITTKSADAQHLFDLGLSLVISFNHDAAIDVFRQAQAADPDCAMCRWGEAFARGSNLNMAVGEDALQLAHDAAQAAKLRASDTPGLEQVLIGATIARYPLTEEGGVAEDPIAFADAMALAAVRFPNDDLVLSLAAEAAMNTQPWDYWEADGHTPKGRTADVITTLETVLNRNPEFVHAIHLYIHATEASDDPWRAIETAEHLPQLAPQSGHLVHMPSHLWYLTGQWKRSMESNLAAAQADELYIASGNAPPLYEYGYYPHNLHFILTSAMMAGDGMTALSTASKLDAALPQDMSSLAPWITLIRPSAYYAHAQFSAPETVLRLPDPGTESVMDKIAWHYARGLAFAAEGDTASAQSETDQIDALVSSEGVAELEAQYLPAGDIARISSLVISARIAAQDGDLPSAISLMERAADLQDALPYSEPPIWYYPARQTLAAMLLQYGQTDRAERMFHRALLKSPNNAHALYGLWQTYKAKGDRRSARYAKHLFKKAWMGKRGTTPDLMRL